MPEKMTKLEFEALLKFHSIKEESTWIKLKTSDLVDVLPDAKSLISVLKRLNANDRYEFLTAIGAKYLDYFKSEEDLVHLVSLVRIPPDDSDLWKLSEEEEPEKFNKIISTQENLVNMIKQLKIARLNVDVLASLITKKHMRNLVLGQKDNLSSFLQKINPQARQNYCWGILIGLGMPLNSIIRDAPEKLGNFKIIMHHYGYNEELSLLLAKYPAQLNNFNDQELLDIMKKMMPQYRVRFLTEKHIIEALEKRPNVLKELVGTMQTVEDATVLIKHYASLISAEEWKDKWRFIVNALTANKSESEQDSLFLALGPDNAKAVLDNFEKITSSMEDSLKSEQSMQKWVDGFMFLQSGWGVINKWSTKEEGDSELHETGKILGVLLAIPFLLASSIIGLVPALIGMCIKEVIESKQYYSQEHLYGWRDTEGAPCNPYSQIGEGFEGTREDAIENYKALRDRFKTLDINGNEEMEKKSVIDDEGSPPLPP